MNARIPSAGYRKETGELAFRGDDGRLVWMSPDSVAASVKDGSLRPDGTVRDASAQPSAISQISAPKGDAEMALAEYDKANPPTPASRSYAAGTVPRPALQAPRARAEPKVDVHPTTSGLTPVRPFESLLPSRALQEPAEPAAEEDGFAAAQESARRSRLLAGLARAGATAVGRGADPGLVALDKNAAAPMADYMAERAHGETVKADASKASDADPASPQSAMAREVMMQVVPGLAKVPGFERLAYSRLMTDPLFEKYAGLIEKQAGAKASMNEKSAALARQAAADAEAARHNKQTEAIGWANASRDRSLALGQRQDQFDDRQVQALEKRVPTETATLKTKLEALDALAGPEDSDIPGVGPLDRLVPDVLAGADSQAVRQLTNGLTAQLLQLQSGKAVSEKEVERKKVELGLGAGSPDAMFRRGLGNLRRELQATLRQRTSGARPEIVERYKSRGGVTAEDLGSAVPPGSERIRMRRPDGQTGTVPADKAAEKEGQGWTRL